MEKYTYKPIRFYITAFVSTWIFWITAVFCGDHYEGVSSVLMVLGLISPAVTATLTVFLSKSERLKNDFKNKVIGFYRIHPLNIIKAVLVFSGIVIISMLTSLLFNQPITQFSFTDDFSFSIYGMSALLTILLASVIEEFGWRGYGEDSIANYCSWFTESIIFGFVWSLWHLPLFWISGTYHKSLMDIGMLYVLNFLISVIPLGFITTWVYVKNNRSMLACIIFHLFVNFMQEKIAMTPTTKCIETIFVTIAAIIIVVRNKNLFFEKNHIGNMLSE